jgi:hypothetical protein
MEESSLNWRKASYSSANGGACVEVAARPAADQVLVRDTKDRQGPILAVSAEAWASFTTDLK